MQKSVTILVAISGFMMAGIVFSFYGSIIITQELSQDIKNIGDGETMKISSEMDPSINDDGVYVIQTMEFKDSMISVSILDPFDSHIVSKIIEKETFEEQFKVTVKGTHTLIIENAGSHTDIAAAIGHVPSKIKFFIGITGFYLVIASLVGIGIVVIYTIKNRK